MPGELPTPVEPLYRISRRSTGLAWPPIAHVGGGRFDDPHDAPAYRVLYAGERQACFFERLAMFRPDYSGIITEPITREWIASRVISEFRIHDPTRERRWLDLRSPETFADFRGRFRVALIAHGYRDFDLAVATTDKRTLTQEIGRWAHEQGYAGIRYCTRHTPELSCWAIFDAIELVDIRERSLSIDDEDLAAVARAWGVALPSRPITQPRRNGA